MSIKPGDVISHTEMCAVENGVKLQRGMNHKLRGITSVILMSVRKGAPYADVIKENGTLLIYEGHDVPKNEARFPKQVDQQMFSRTGKLTQNGKFFESVKAYKLGEQAVEFVKVYEKIKKGIWVFNGVFELVDAEYKKSPNENRKVFKFKLAITDKTIDEKKSRVIELKDLSHNRMIPTSVKLEVWKRDKGRCVTCGSTDNLHFDHILPFSKGGTSLKAENIQLLCARHNLDKTNKII